MHCPRHRHHLVERHQQNAATEHCGECGGCFIGKASLDESAGHFRSDGRRIDYAALPASPLHCPADGEPMRALRYRGVEIDLCPACEGAWLDAGELQAITRQRGVQPGLRQGQPREKRGADESSDIAETAAETAADIALDGDLGVGDVLEFVGEAIGSLFSGI